MAPLPYLMVAVACLYYVGLIYSIPSDATALLTDPDSGWHLMAGDLIRASGKLPLHDPWSFTAGNEIWYNIAWGWDVIISYLHAYLGWYGQIAAASVLIGLTITVIFYHAYLRSSNVISGLLLSIMAFLFGIAHLRPLLVSNLLVAISLLLFFQVYRRGVAEKWLWALPFMVAVWVNFHGGFILLALIGGAHLLEDILSKNWRRTRLLCLVGLACAAATLLNPYGLYIYEGIWRTVGSSSKLFIDEWKPLQWNISYAMYWLYIGFCIFLLLWKNAFRVIPLAEKCLLAVSLYMAITSIRHMTFFILVSAPVMAWALAALLKKTDDRVHSRAEQWVDDACIRLNRRGAAAAGFAVAALATTLLFSPVLAAYYPVYRQQPYGEIREDLYWLQAHYPQQRFLNAYGLGGPMIYLSQGTFPVFIDGRAETAYPKAVTHDYALFETQQPGWENLMDKYALDGLILLGDKKHAQLSRLAQWKLVRQGKYISVWLYNRKNRPQRQ